LKMKTTGLLLQPSRVLRNSWIVK